MSASPTMWKVYAGGYAFLGGVAVIVALASVTDAVTQAIGVSTVYASIVIAFPAILTGTIAWGVIVEQRRHYAYSTGVWFGAATAVLTVFVWLFVFVFLRGPLFLTRVTVILPVLAGAAVVGGLAGVPLMYARTRSGTPEGA